MKFEAHNLYHIYNQGNNREPLFFNTGNYLYFLKSVRKFISPSCDILAYCLMPNHFHFLVNTTDTSVISRKVGSLEMSELAFGFKSLQSSFAQAINKQEKRTGSLFRQKTKAKCLTDGSLKGYNIKDLSRTTSDYATTVFHYIHQNPMKAGLVNRMEDWPFSSFSDYAGLRNGTLCKQELAYQWLNINQATFLKDSYGVIL